ncbi:MAG TPA: alpha/beta fold hydrolase [Acidimicrobiia bacterium]|nr:alpha/beta fold hydrolase [Acidimicrobiia bacterium]
MNPSVQTLPFAPSENPFVIEHGGFYRRWLKDIVDLTELQTAVATLSGTTDNLWVPVWRSLGRAYEEKGEGLEVVGDYVGARHAFLQARTFYSIGRFPEALTPLKRDVSDDCNRAYLRACSSLVPPLQVVSVQCEGKAIISHYRVPAGASASNPVPAVLIMCGADVFKEDRGWAADLALVNGLAVLVMDAPGTGQNPFPHEPPSVQAWAAAIDWLADRPEVLGGSIGALGISRGGYSVMQLAGTYPEKVQAAVAIAGNHFGYRMNPDESEAFVRMKNERSGFLFGAPGDPPTFPQTTLEEEDALFMKWSLSELGLVDRIVCPLLMINGKRDHLAPIGNIYYMLEHGPVIGKEARIYPDDGHCAFKYRDEWAPASFDWLARKLSAQTV